MKGEVKIFNKGLWDYDFIKLNQLVGLVKQNPLEQLVTFTVRDEIAFGLENLKYPIDEIENKVNEIATFMGIDSLLERNIDQLSGGQKQLTILSSFLVLNPKILILDEPIAFLDQQSESLLLDRLKSLNKSKEFSLTLIIIEHRLSRVIDSADKLVILDETGKIALKGEVTDILHNHFDELKSCNVRVPWLIDIFDAYRKITKNEIVIENSMNFQKFFNLISKFDENNALLLDKTLQPLC